jgi:homeobox protein cut-like
VLFTSPNFQLQILHGELETSLRAAEEELIAINSKLEKQQQLNEKLENDLLDFEKHQQAQVNGKHEAREALKGTASSDALAGIELGKKPSVCVSLSKPVPWDNSEY